MPAASLACGPVAVALITGVHGSIVNRALAISGIDGESTAAGDLSAALEDLGGYALWQIEYWDEWLAGPSLAAWLKRRPPDLADAPLLLMAECAARDGAHWLAAWGDCVGDSFLMDAKWAKYRHGGHWRVAIEIGL
jgi:hypothetical protein